MNYAEDEYRELAQRAYKEHNGSKKLEEAWVMGILDDYDPVTKYVFSNEIERKGSRLAEGVISTAETMKKATVNSPPVKKEFDKGASYVTWQTDVFSITIEDAATIQAFRDNGVKKVRWHTAQDEKVCKECDERDNKVYPISAIPPKPHPNCRCWVTPE